MLTPVIDMKGLTLKITNLFLQLGVLLLLFACKKDAPSPLGEYNSNFLGHYMFGDSAVQLDEKNIKFELTEFTDTALIFNNNYFTYVHRNGDSLYGELSGGFLNSYHAPHSINGKWEQFGDIYFISGTFGAPLDSWHYVEGIFHMIKD